MIKDIINYHQILNTWLKDNFGEYNFFGANVQRVSGELIALSFKKKYKFCPVNGIGSSVSHIEKVFDITVWYHMSSNAINRVSVDRYDQFTPNCIEDIKGYVNTCITMARTAIQKEYAEAQRIKQQNEIEQQKEVLRNKINKQKDECKEENNRTAQQKEAEESYIRMVNELCNYLKIVSKDNTW